MLPPGEGARRPNGYKYRSIRVVVRLNAAHLSWPSIVSASFRSARAKGAGCTIMMAGKRH